MTAESCTQTRCSLAKRFGRTFLRVGKYCGHRLHIHFQPNSTPTVIQIFILKVMFAYKDVFRGMHISSVEKVHPMGVQLRMVRWMTDSRWIVSWPRTTVSQDVQTRFPVQLAFAKFLSKIKGNF